MRNIFASILLLLLCGVYFSESINLSFIVYGANNSFKKVIIKDVNINIAFLGDVMIGGRVRDSINKKGLSSTFSGTSEFLSKKDMVVLNLETSVTESKKKVRKTYTFKADKNHLSGLKSFNKNLYVNLANNHTGDFGEEGMVETMKNLKDNNIEFFGLGNNINEANQIKIADVKGAKIGFIGQNCISPTSFKASENKIGTAFFDKELLKKQLEIAKENKVDIIILNGHCGIEYSNGPNKQQVEYYHYAIDNGVDLVIGHHPHWYQGIERYKGKIIFYSLGDYIFDIFRGRRTEEGIIADVFIKDKKISKINLEAVHIYDYGETKMANLKQKKVILDELQLLSNKLSDIKTIKDGYIDY